MNEYLDASNKNLNPEDFDVERKLRPLTFDDFAGQEQVIENLRVFVKAANLRGEALDHTLFYGSPGLGKSSLAYFIANVLDTNVLVTSRSVLDKPGDLSGLLTIL